MPILEKRVRTLETMLTRQRLKKEPSGEQPNHGAASLLEQLEGLTQEANRMKEQAEAEGDFRTALAAISLMCRIVELAAKLRGELDEKIQTNVLNLHLDPDTANRIAETYLARHKKLESK